MSAGEVIEPMLATLGEPPAGDDVALEFKWDGIRCLAYVDDGVRLFSRNGRDITTGYPELAELVPLAAGHRVVLDGELVALDSAGVASFERLQQRMHLSAPAPALVTAVPVVYEVFDLLFLDGEATTALPYLQRRELLAGLDLAGDAVRVPAHFVNADPAAVLTAARSQGLEGIVAKRLGSTYQSGRRSRDWIKVPFNQTQEIVVIGWKPGGGRRSGTIGSLLTAVTGPDGNLAYAGGVGTGFTQAMLEQLQGMLAPLSRPTPAVAGIPRVDARGARWVEPVIVGEVSFRNWTGDGKMRHPSWRGLRPDKSPARVPRVTPPVETIDGVMQTLGGSWRVEVVRRGSVTSYRIVHGEDVIDWLPDIADVERILTRAGVAMEALQPAQRRTSA
ncbi:non-homologous end-joining DNA ligase [Actinoplanes friuliensis]|uniref:DNA ligase (ATP) n=1 Tax=Actinoplanes friuliensis DSM 7358 TaxID=1246995 RepID=U5W7K1_9ACTN|nr:non-homologous end-joining DNA ligase [Actinoplanes friuliensis]AGZ43975.1 DNA polymerase LigD ligase domain-containing protein [Actinoplanes friuliensis DSM 7358]